jgi:Na+/proline symporter
MLSLIQSRYGSRNNSKSTEEFNAASRLTKPDMIAAGIVSSWANALTLLTSCTLGSAYGVGGSLLYRAVGTCQTLSFAVAASRSRRKVTTVILFLVGICELPTFASIRLRNRLRKAWEASLHNLYILLFSH